MLIELCIQMEQNNEIAEHISLLWESIMTNVANTYGSFGEYNESNIVSLKIMKECIHCYRMGAFVLNLYSMAWNNEECIKKNIPLDRGI